MLHYVTVSHLPFRVQFGGVWRMVLLWLIMLFCAKARASTFYFSSSAGSDTYTTAQAQRQATPWQTIEKLNSFFGNLQPGDTVLFKRGDVFFGTIRAAASGSQKKPLQFGAWGNGADPVISGLVQIQQWNNTGNNIWESEACGGCGIKANVVLVKGAQKPMGRYPNADAANKGFLTYEAHVTNKSIHDNELPASPNWSGAELIIKKERWTIDRSLITNHSGNTISYNSQTDYHAHDGCGYFIQNDIRTLDQPYEWYYNAGNKKIYLYLSNAPANVQVSAADNLFYIHNQNNIEVNDLSFTGANLTAIDLESSHNISFNRCSISFSGRDGVYGAGLTNFTFTNSSITNTNNNAIYLAYDCHYSTLTNNKVRNTGTYIGLGDGVHYNSFCGITVAGSSPSHCTHTVIENNVIDSTGYNAISFRGDDVSVKNNFINAFCFTKDDGGGIYTHRGLEDKYVYRNRTVAGNIILNGKTAAAGTDEPELSSTYGIYIDDNAQDVAVLNNTVAGVPNSGIFLHNAQHVQLRGNTLYNNGEQLKMGHDASGDLIENVSYNDNILFAKSAEQLCLLYKTIDNNISYYGMADSNFYCRPQNESSSIYTTDAVKFASLDLENWQVYSGVDNNSDITALSLTDYTINKLTGNNKAENGSFDKNIGSSYCYNEEGTSQASWDGSGKLGDGGSLKVSYKRSKGGINYVIVEVGEVSAGKNYVLRFSAISIKEGQSMGAFLRQSGAPYATLSEVQYCVLGKSRNDFEMRFTAGTKESQSSLVFQVNTVDSTFWLDNIELYKADVSNHNPDDSIRFEYNATVEDKMIQLDDTYTGVDGTVYRKSVKLPPFSSLILLRGGKRKTGKTKRELISANRVNQRRMFVPATAGIKACL